MFKSRLCVLVLLGTIPACAPQPAEPTARTTFPVNQVPPQPPNAPTAPEPVATDIVPPQGEVVPREAIDGTLAVEGQKLFLKMRCTNCHTGTAAAKAPTLERLYGSRVVLKGGAAVTADAAYLAESIRNPSAKVVAGWEATMPPYNGKALNADELKALVEFIKSLRAGRRVPQDAQVPPLPPLIPLRARPAQSQPEPRPVSGAGPELRPEDLRPFGAAEVRERRPTSVHDLFSFDEALWRLHPQPVAPAPREKK